MARPRFDELAADYALDIIAFPEQAMLQERVGRSVRSHCDQQGGVSLELLEIGCGTGLTSEAILQATDGVRGLHITLLDESYAMLAQARCALLQYSGQVFVHQEARRYLAAVASGSLDLIVAVQTLHNIDRDQRALLLRSVRDVLSPKGVFIVGDLMYSSVADTRDSQFSYMLRCVDRYAELGRQDLHEKWLSHIYDDFDEQKRVVVPAFKEELRRAGFGRIDLRELTELRHITPYTLMEIHV